MHVAIIAATAALGGLLFGYDTGVISGALLFLREAFHLSSLMLGVVTSIALAGAAGGAAGAGLLADRFGRRPVLLAIRCSSWARSCPRWRVASPCSSPAACWSGSASAARPC